MAFVELRGINKLYGRTHVVHDVYAEFEEGEFVSSSDLRVVENRPCFA